MSTVPRCVADSVALWLRFDMKDIDIANPIADPLAGTDRPVLTGQAPVRIQSFLAVPYAGFVESDGRYGTFCDGKPFRPGGTKLACQAQGFQLGDGIQISETLVIATLPRGKRAQYRPGRTGKKIASNPTC